MYTAINQSATSTSSPLLESNTATTSASSTNIMQQSISLPINQSATSTSFPLLGSSTQTITNSYLSIEDLVLWSPTEYNPIPTDVFSSYTVAVSQGTNMTISVSFGDGDVFNFKFDASQSVYMSNFFN